MDWTVPAVAFTLSGILLIWVRSKFPFVKFKKSKDQNDQQLDKVLQSTYNKLVLLLEEDQIFLNKSIKVADLASKLNQKEKTISRAINKHSNRNFNTFINSFRVQYSKELLESGRLDHYTIEAIAEECGFANKVSFYNAFKSDTGMSPKQFRALKHPAK
ncbi:MAG: AraC family transcriptional regulator [Cyclobacteriaceae bacterium]